MKKRLLSALLALALVFVLLPTTALAGEVSYGNDYDIAINGIKWKFEKNDSGEYIPVYYYANNKFSTDADDKIYKFYTNDNLMLTKKGDTVTISFRRGTSYQFDYYHQVKFTIESKAEGSDISCIEMGNGNNLVITGEGTKGTLILTRDGKDGIGAALSSKEGNITITGGATVNVTFKKQSTPNVSGHAISVDNHDLIISGEGTTVEATNQSGASQDFSNDATVKVENGRIDVSGGAWLKATNEFSNTSKPYPSDFNNYSYFSCAISGDKDAPCTVSVTGENSCIIASAHNSTKYVNTSMGQAYRWANFKVDGAKIEVGTSSPAQTITDINDISNYKYAKISVPALQRTSDVLIAGKDAVVGVRTSLGEGNGYYTYNKDTKTLTLEDATISSGINAIQFMAKGAYTIKLEGENKISNVSNGIFVTDDQYITSLNVTITGSGSLDISAKGLAINMEKGDLKFENTGAIKLATGNIGLNNNALSVKGNITITDMSKYSVTGTQQTRGKPLGSEVSLTEASQLKGGTTGYRIITITPAAAKPSTIRYNGTTLKQGETIYGETSGTATVDRKNNTITLNNFKGTKALSFEATLADSTLVLEGTNTLSSIVTTQKGLTISGSGSLTVGSIRVPNNTQNTANLTITGGAHVTVNRPSGEDEPAVEVSGNLTVTGDGTQLSAECTAATNPAIEVGGNVTISGNPGTNAYTVKAYNKYATPRGRDDKLRPSQMPSAIEISGDSLSISNSAQVMAKTDSDGAAVWMPKQKVISVVDASLIAQNRSHNFSTISFGDESNMGNIYAKGQVNIVAENMLGSNSRLAHRAIKAYIYNHYSTGDSNPYYIKVVSEGVQSGGNVNVIPGDCTSTGGYKVTITRGDAYVAPTKTITEIIVTGLTPPVKGATPVDKSKVTLTDGLTVESITWGPALTSDGKFAANTAYTAHINYSVKAGYELAANANCPQVAGANVTRWHQEGMPQDEIEVTFPKTAADTTHQHTSETGWETDGTNHWKTCSTCSQRYNEGACTISGYNNDNGASGYHKVLCSVGHVMKTESHDYEYKITQDGTMHYKECKTCHYTIHPVSHNFGSSGTESCECGAIPSHTHNLSGQKGNDETNHWDICSECSQHVNEAPHTYGAWITDTPATDTTDGSKHRTCSVCQYQENATIPKTGTGEIEPPTPDNPGTIVIIRPAEEEKPAQQPNPSTGANDLVGLAVAAAVAAALGSAALLRKHD